MRKKKAEFLKDRIEQLVFISSEHIKLTSDISKFYSKYTVKINKNLKLLNSNELHFLKVHQHLYYNEAVTSLTSLLEKKKKNDKYQPEEISYLNLVSTDNYECKNLKLRIDEIRSRNEYRLLYYFRNNIINHKNYEIAGDPIANYSNFIAEKNIVIITDLISELKKINFECFNNESIRTNSIYNLTKSILDTVYERIKIQIDKT